MGGGPRRPKPGSFPLLSGHKPTYEKPRLPSPLALSPADIPPMTKQEGAATARGPGGVLWLRPVVTRAGGESWTLALPRCQVEPRADPGQLEPRGLMSPLARALWEENPKLGARGQTQHTLPELPTRKMRRSPLKRKGYTESVGAAGV